MAEWLQLETIFSTAKKLKQLITNDPIQWGRHDYDTNEANPGVGNKICSTITTTEVEIAGNGGFTREVIKIPPELCTLENIWCWAKRNPAPRVNGNEGTVISGEDSVLVMGDNPIRTHVFDNEMVLVNNTLGDTVIDGMSIDEHTFHDPLSAPNCGDEADFNNIDLRCGYVHRQVVMMGGDIHITTHGEGHNPTNFMELLNEVGGRVIFNNVDTWIQKKIAKEGICTDDP